MIADDFTPQMRIRLLAVDAAPPPRDLMPYGKWRLIGWGDVVTGAYFKLTGGGQIVVPGSMRRRVRADEGFDRRRHLVDKILRGIGRQQDGGGVTRFAVGKSHADVNAAVAEPLVAQFDFAGKNIDVHVPAPPTAARFAGGNDADARLRGQGGAA